MNRFTLLTALTAFACGSPSGTPSTSPTPSQQGGEASNVQPTDEQLAYGRMAAVAMKQSRFLTLGNTVGLFQWDDMRHPLYPIVKIVLENNSFREIHKGQMNVACSVPDRPGLRGTDRSQARVCGLDRADVLLQLMTVQIMRDSGYVGGYITQVYKGEDRPKTTVFCFIAVWRQTQWEDVHNSLVKEPMECSFGRKHFP
jgi:hypothetical protein